MNSHNLSQNNLIEAMNVVNNLMHAHHVPLWTEFNSIRTLFFSSHFFFILSLSLSLNFGTASTVQITFILDLMILVFLSLHYPFFNFIWKKCFFKNSLVHSFFSPYREFINLLCNTIIKRACYLPHLAHACHKSCGYE